MRVGSGGGPSTGARSGPLGSATSSVSRLIRRSIRDSCSRMRCMSLPAGRLITCSTRVDVPLTFRLTVPVARVAFVTRSKYVSVRTAASMGPPTARSTLWTALSHNGFELMTAGRYSVLDVTSSQLRRVGLAGPRHAPLGAAVHGEDRAGRVARGAAREIQGGADDFIRVTRTAGRERPRPLGEDIHVPRLRDRRQEGA